MSSFEQRLISEIEFRLERSPVEESDDDVQHDQDSAGQGVAPSFTQKLKHYKVFEGMPVTFSCKVHGDPKPKVGGLFWTARQRYIMVILKRLGQLSFLALKTQMCDADDSRCTFCARAACCDQERSTVRPRCPPLTLQRCAGASLCSELLSASILTSRLSQRSSHVTGLLVQGRQTDLQEERALQDQPRRQRDLFSAHCGRFAGRRWELHHHGQQP